MTDARCPVTPEMVQAIVEAIVAQPLLAGGTFLDVIVLLKMVNVGVLLASVQVGGDDEVIEKMMGMVKVGVAEYRLRARRTEGTA